MYSDALFVQDVLKTFSHFIVKTNCEIGTSIK